MKYITKEDDIFDVKAYDNMKRYKPLMLGENGAPAEENFITALYENGVVDETDIEIINYIYKSRFVTLGQIKKFAAIKIGVVTNIEKRLETMFVNVIINKIAIVAKGFQATAAMVGNDAEFVYVLNTGGMILLEHYRYPNGAVLWGPKDARYFVPFIRRSLVSNQIVLSTLEDPRIQYFGDYLYEIKNGILNTEAELRLFIPEHTDGRPIRKAVITHGFDSVSSERAVTEAMRNFGDFLSTNIWKKFFYKYETPLLLIIVEDDEMAASIVEQWRTISRHKPCAITTPELLKKGILNPESFYMWNEEANGLEISPVGIFDVIERGEEF